MHATRPEHKPNGVTQHAKLTGSTSARLSTLPEERLLEGCVLKKKLREERRSRARVANIAPQWTTMQTVHTRALHGDRERLHRRAVRGEHHLEPPVVQSLEHAQVVRTARGRWV